MLDWVIQNLPEIYWSGWLLSILYCIIGGMYVITKKDKRGEYLIPYFLTCLLFPLLSWLAFLSLLLDELFNYLKRKGKI